MTDPGSNSRQTAMMSAFALLFALGLVVSSEAAPGSNGELGRLEPGILHAAAGRLDAALDHLRGVVAENPGSAAAHHVLAQLLLLGDAFEAAKLELESARGLGEIDAEVGARLGLALIETGRHPRMVRLAESLAAAGFPPSPDVRTEWGKALVVAGHSAEADVQLAAAIAEEPGHVGALLVLGKLRLAVRDRPEDGIELLELATAMNPGHTASLRELGRAYLVAGRFTEAHNLLQRALAGTDESSPEYEALRVDLEALTEAVPPVKAPAEAPNVLLVIVDTLRADHLRTYGYARETAPNLDRLARQGVVFENAISQAPWTAPSVATMLTGMYPSVHGLDGGIVWTTNKARAGRDLPFAVQKVLSPYHLTLAEVLRRNGYRTAGFVSNAYLNSIFGFTYGFEIYQDQHSDYSADPMHAKRRADETNREVFEWLDRNSGGPFFLLVHYNDCHWPYDPPPGFTNQAIRDYTGTLKPAATAEFLETKGEPVEGLSAADLDYIRGLYDGEISYVDSEIGRLLDRVRAEDPERDLAIVVVSDHGEEFLDHGSASHGYTLFDEMIRVPFIIAFPGRFPAGRVTAQVRMIDLMPTVLDLAGVGPVPPEVQGTNLGPWLRGEASVDVGPAYTEATYAGEMKSIQAGGHKLIVNFDRPGANLFDLRADPGESKPVTEQSPVLARQLLQQLMAWMAGNRELASAARETQREVIVDEKVLERLRALGYVD